MLQCEKWAKIVEREHVGIYRSSSAISANIVKLLVVVFRTDNGGGTRRG